MRPPLRLILTADLHLGAAFSFLGSEAAAVMRQKQLQVLRDLCQLAAEREIDFMLIAGDLFDSPEPEQALLRAAQQSFALCPHCRIVISPGNHDPYYPQSLWDDSHWPSHVFVAKPGESVFDFADKGLRIYSAPFLARSSRVPIFQTVDPPLDPEWTNLLLLHGELLSAGADSNYNPIPREWLLHSGFDLAVLGHIHKRSELIAEKGAVPYLYPGCPFGRGFDESGDCGCYVGELYPADSRRGLASEAEFRFRPSGKGSFLRLRLSLDAAAAENQDELADFLRLEIQRAAIDSEALKRDAVELSLTGSSELRPDTDYLTRVLKDSCFYLKIRDESFMPSPFLPYTKEKSLRGYLAQVLQEAGKHALTEEEKKILRESEHLLAEALEGELKPYATP